jgi:hypothetical protein
MQPKLLHAVKFKSAVVYMVGTGFHGRNAAHFAFSVYRPQMEIRRISRGEIRGKKMEIQIGAEVEMRRISSLHS